jgi:hypothetical protein
LCARATGLLVCIPSPSSRRRSLPSPIIE